MILLCLAWVRKPLPFSLSTWVLFACTSFTCLAQTPQSESVPLPLEIGKPLERELTGGKNHLYQLSLSSGQYLHLIVDQRGIDVLVTLFGPDGKKLFEVDSPNGERGPEPLYWVAESAGDYRLEVRSLEEKAASGRYEVKIVTLHAATEPDRKRARANIALVEGENLFDERKPESYRLVVKQYETAVPLFREIGEPAGEASARFKLGEVHNRLSEKPQALDNYKEAARLYRELKDRVWEAVALNNVAAMYTDLGEKHKALDAYTEAVKLYREVKNQSGEAIALNGLGTVYRDLGERPKALQYYLLSLQLRRDLKDRAGEAATLNNLAALYDDLGEVQKMLDTNAQVLQLRNDPRGRAITLTNIGRGYDRLGLPQEALSYYNQALPLTRSVSDKLWEARTLNYMGTAYWSLGEYQTALSYLNQALPLFRAVKNPVGEGATLNNMGLVYNSLHEPSQGLRVYQQALPLFQAAKDRQAEASLLNVMGAAYDQLGEKSKALDHQTRSLKLSREVGDPRRVAKALYSLARIEREQGKLKQARAQIEQTIALVESLRIKLDSPEIRAAYRASTEQYYELYVDVLMRMHRQQPRNKFSAEALQVSERARARSLIELLNEAGADIRQGVDPTLMERTRELQEKINDKTTAQLKLLSSNHTSEQSTAFAQELENLASALRDTQAQLRRSSPRYAALTQPEPLTVRQMQEQLLDPNTLLLEYALGEERSYLWAVTAHSLHSFTLPRRAVIEAAARRYYELLTARNEAPPNESTQRKQARIVSADAESRPAGMALSRMLLGPVAAQLGTKRLMIVSDGALQYVPFGALPDPVVGGRWSVVGKDAKANRQPATDHRPPLIVQHEIINLPSASTLAVLRKEMIGRQPATKVAVVIADPVFDNKDERVRTVAIGAGNKVVTATSPPPTTDTARILLLKTAKATGVADTESRIPRLPNTRREAEAILALVSPTGSHAAFDFAASRNAAMSEELGNYRIIHFATHGFLNSSNPALSGLVLSLVDEKGTAQNGFLLAPEIYQLKLSATELVVLSACQTGLGQEVRGEGVIGLTRGFMYAGAPRVVVSLWNVSDQATADLMKLFYEAMLKQGMRPAAALRAAQVALWKQQKWHAPYYWAAFGLQGEWR